MVTLTGPGGVGKTRLALQAAADALPLFADGAWLCELANVADPDAVHHSVLAALGFVVRPGATPRTALLEALAERELLLLVDNCEHVRAAAAGLIADVVHTAPDVRVLATSREPLGVTGEHLWAVEPLPVESGAVDLFAERAAAARRGFALTPENRTTITEICSHLDGLPLAIELAAARVRSLSPEDLRDRLGERFRLLTAGRSGREGRQATLRATVDWSYELLAADERVLFDRLSIFAGGFDLAAATAVAADPGADELDVLDLLTALVDKSMVQLLNAQGNTRYGLLETMRQYGAERIQVAGAAEEIARRHAQHYAGFADQAAEGLRGPDEATWAQAIDADFDNLRVATRWALDHQDVDIALRLVAALWTYPIDRMVPEPGEWAEQALHLPGSDRHPLAALTHISAGYGAQQGGRYGETLSHGQAAITLAEANSPRHLWLALNVAVGAALYLGQSDLAAPYLKRLLPSARADGDDYDLSRAWWTPQNFQRTIPIGIDVPAGAAECLALAERVGNPTLLARAHFVNGVALGADNPRAAAQHFAFAERHARLADTRYLISMGIAYTAGAVSLFDPFAAHQELLRLLDWHRSTGIPMGVTRIALRDLLPALSGLGLHRLVAVLDADLPAAALFSPVHVAAAVARAHQALGPVETERARSEARAMDPVEVLAMLRGEVEGALRPCAPTVVKDGP